MTNLKPDTWHLPSFITTILLLYFNVFIVNTTIFVSSHQQTADNTWTCLSREQLIALSNSKNTYRFEAQIIQLDKGITDHDVNSNAFVKITKILRQPIGKFKQITLHELVHVNEIKSRDLPVDARVTQYDECLPKLERGKVYEWITYSLEDNDESNDGIQKQFTLLPGGVFSSILSPPGLSSSATVSMKFNQNNGSHSEVCSKRECRFSAICEEWLSKDTNQYIGVCVCPTLMDMARNHMCNINSGTICTTNGIFYLNECVMLHQACLKQTELKPINLNIFSRILSQSDCTQLIERTSSASSNQLSILNASTLRPNYQNDYGINLQPSHSNNLQPKTDEIPQHDSPLHIQQSSNIAVLEYNTGEANPYRCSMKTCPTELNPVCDSDGTIYANDCLLKKYTCQKFGNTKLSGVFTCGSKHQRNHRQKTELCGNGNLCLYGGKCYDPLDYYKSSSSSSTTITRKRMLSIFSNCMCDGINCLKEWPDPICADDGETYSNQCFLKRAICETQSMKRVLYRGNCASNPCLHHTCRWQGEKCQVDINGQAKCICPEPCPPVISPVCGSDGVTYDSTCHLERTACQKMREIHVLYSGECSQAKDCLLLNQPCQGYEICSRIKNPMVYGSVNRGLDTAAYGLTNSFEDTIPQCICPTCPENGLGGQVCGSDGQTYRSECHLRSSACQRHSLDLTVKSRGKCDACQTKQCKYYAICQLSAFGEPQCICPTDCLYVRKPVCGTDGKTYENECFLKVKSCADQREVHVAQEGYCRPCAAGCPLGFQCRNGQCVCRDTCPPKHPTELDVCGTDGKLYPSECELKRQSCIQQANIDVDLTGVRCRGRTPTGMQDSNMKMSAVLQADGVRIPTCTCNKLGALSEECDYLGNCRCKWGVGGLKCDQCLGNYWGIQNNHECIPCSCHPLGSVDASCNQATGQCNCRAGVVGRQCSMCPDGSQVTENDCNAKEKNENLLARLQEDGNQLTNGRNDPAKQKISKNTTITLNSQSSDIIINTTSNDNNDAEQNNGRLFTETTTLLVRIPFHMDQPTELQLTLRLLEANGMLLHYQSPPSEQEQLLLYNAQDHQFTMGISNWRVVLKYIDGRVPNRILLVHSKENLTRNVKHTIQTGIVSGRPWIQIDESTRTTNQDVIEKWANKPSDNDGNNDNNNVPTVGGLGTVVIGRHIKLGSLSASAMDERMEAHEDYGFSGCLSKVTINAGSPTKHFALDLLHSTKTNLAWLGIEPNPSTGLIEAPICPQSVNTLALSIADRPNGGSVVNDNTKRLLQSDQVQRQEDLVNSKTRQVPNPMSQTKNCKNYGIDVITRDGKYACICQPGWQGYLCEQVVTIIPQFSGNGFIRLAGPTGKQAMKRKKLHIELVFLATKASGLLFIIPPKSQYQGPFITAYIDSQNYLTVVCRIGTGTTRNDGNTIQLKYNEPIKLNQWHTLTIDKLPKVLRVRINSNKKQRIPLISSQYLRTQNRLPKELTNFDLSSSPIYLGGYDFRGQPTSVYLPVKRGLDGAIQRININDAEVVLAGPSLADMTNTPEEMIRSSNLIEKWVNVSQWQGAPCGPEYSPCQMEQPDNICRPNIQRATCACTTPLQLMHMMKGRLDEQIDEVEKQACLQRKMEISKMNPVLSSRNDGQLQYDGPNRGSIGETINEPIEDILSSNNEFKQILINFSGSTVYKYSGLMGYTSDFNIRLRLRTDKMDGLILLMVEQPTAGQSDHHQHHPDSSSSLILNQPVTQITTNSEFVSLVLRNGRIELLLNLISSSRSQDKSWEKKKNIVSNEGDNGGVSNSEFNRLMPIQARHKVNDGEWHVIQAIGSKQRATLFVDNHMVSGEFSGITDSNSAPVRDVYLGGTLSKIIGLSHDYQQNFTGCIADMLIQERIIPILSEATEIYGPIERCRNI